MFCGPSEKEIIEKTSANSIKEFHKLQSVDRLLQFIREEKPHFTPRIKKDDLFKPYYVIAKKNNQRIIVQSGAFLVFGLKWREESYFARDISAYLLRIPATSKKVIRKQISLLGINYSTVFPEIDRASTQIVEDYLPEA